MEVKSCKRFLDFYSTSAQNLKLHQDHSFTFYFFQGIGFKLNNNTGLSLRKQSFQ